MSLHRYYRSTNAQVAAAVKEFFEQRDALHKVVRAFVKRFGGKDALWYQTFGYRFAGIYFDATKPPKDEHLWTKRDKSGMRHPKATGGGDAAHALRAEWKKHYPDTVIHDDKWLATLGLKPAFGRPGITLLKDGATVLIHTSQPITNVPDVVEIMASEYETLTK